MAFLSQCGDFHFPHICSQIRCISIRKPLTSLLAGTPMGDPSGWAPCLHVQPGNPEQPQNLPYRLFLRIMDLPHSGHVTGFFFMCFLVMVVFCCAHMCVLQQLGLEPIVLFLFCAHSLDSGT